MNQRNRCRCAEIFNFASFPADIQYEILDWLLDRRWPIRPLVTNRTRFWLQLRLVCKDWAEWYSLTKIRRIDIFGQFRYGWRLANIPLIPHLSNLQNISIDNYENGDKEIFRHIPHLLPSSVRYLCVNSAEFLKELDLGKFTQLRNVNWIIRNEIDIDLVELVLMKYKGLLKTLELSYTFSPSLIYSEMMRNLLSKKGEGITRMKLRCRWNLISIPSTIREIISYCKEDFQASWLSPDQVSKITNIDIRWSSFILPAAWSQPFESLKQLMADKIILPIYINDSSTLFPEVENLLLGPTTPASFNRMKKLRELSVTKFYNSPFRLTDLPDTLYKFRFYGEYNDVEFQGLPPTMVKVKKIVWSTIRSFPDGFFTRFPFLNSLSLSYCRVFDIEVFQPIYQTLIQLSLRYDSALNAVSRVSGLSRFTRLKRVSIYCYCKNSRIHIEDLPLSLEKLCFNGNLRLPEPNASLKFNQLVYFKSEKMCVRSILGFFFLHSAPSLKSIEIEVSQYELPKIIMEMEESGQLNSSVEKLCWEFPNINEFDQFLILLLGRFPNLRKLTITQSCHYASQFSGVPELLLSVIQNGQCGLCLEQVKIISPKAIIHAEQTKVVAQLKQIGVSFDMKTSRY